MEAGLSYKHILLTGPPGIGKTTVVRKVYEKLKEYNTIRTKGFYTEEIKSGGKRIGFDICSLDGRRGPLARISSGGSDGPRVGQYVVNLSSFENLALPALETDNSLPTVLIIDEIGKMELFSTCFRQSVKEQFGRSPSLKILATVPVRSRGKPLSFVEDLKKRNDVEIYVVTKDNRDEVVAEIAEKLVSN
ncbi:cancer-related nucleoside-triphosphatase homolog [Centruroides sculpturatus]|uniref:cancer-related nucleoside-triphosphatase homolog n=1 Tax=Centruroides sculpturatus TaxID=218467 RepID=UPI000C6D23FE|nr:cancer-related nucleoside-triphosphatase homolog [Centruroides sculpturatus]